MINLLLGSSGGGKSFEAVVYQILPALERGRKVITNLPLNIEAFASINHTFPDLIELRTKPQLIRGDWTPTESQAFSLFPSERTQKPDLRSRVFANVWDYYDDWKHPDSGIGALFVIDECQYSIPRGRTDIKVEEFTALHRHYKVDILYITQSYGKISKTVVDNLQMVYRVRKQTALGRQTHYIRKVQDGVRGEVMSITSREYISAYFQLYQSHTQSTGIGSESGASDVTPLWKHWTFMGAGICLLIVIFMILTTDAKNPLEHEVPEHVFESTKTDYKKAVYEKPSLNTFDDNLDNNLDDNLENEKYLDKDYKEKLDHPFSNFTLYISGTYHNKITNSYVYILGLIQNGIVIETFQDKELTLSGYTVKALSRCAFQIEYNDYKDWVTCGKPTQTII